ncbi:MAG TPA: hypothetical protein VIF84_09205 [Candidatus Limnocylindrales bacterium]
MTPSLLTRRLFAGLASGVLVAACTATAAVPDTTPTAQPVVLRSPAPTTEVTLPAPSLGPTLPPTAIETPRPTPTTTPPPPGPAVPELDPPVGAKGPFGMDLHRKRDFVTQMTPHYCVPAAMQTMINIMSPGADQTRDTQDALYKLARRLSTKKLVGKGAEPEGWARGLTELGFGAYEVGVHATRRDAVQAAAKAIRLTGRPVGLLVWRGAHSWVMSGFQATADPAVTDDYVVTGVVIEDVWYPRVSSIWGASEPPESLVRVRDLDKDYLRWRRPTRRYANKDGQFVTILPVPGRPSEEQS